MVLQFEHGTIYIIVLFYLRYRWL